MGKTKKQTKQQLKDKAAAAAKRVTHGKIMGGVALGAGVIRQGLGFAETGDEKWLTVGLVENYTGINTQMGTFDFGKTVRGLGPPIVYKGEKMLFKIAGVKGPPLKPKGFKDYLRLIAYHGAGAANVYQGHSPRDKFQRFVHSHYGIKMNESGMDALDITTPLMQKWLPYIAVSKILQLVK